MYLNTYVHSRIIHNNQMVEATQDPTDKGMDEQNTVSMGNGIVFSLK